jgi:hypothetical protein
MNEAFWAALAGGAVSVITALVTAEYNLRRMKAEEDRKDVREERQFQRERLQELERRHIEPITQDIAALEAFSRAVSHYYVLANTLGRQHAETTAAGIEFARLSGSAYLYADLVTHVESFRTDLDETELQDLLEAVTKVKAERQAQLNTPSSKNLDM